MRLDQRLADLGLAESRARARALIEARAVTVDNVAGIDTRRVDPALRALGQAVAVARA